MATAKTRWFGRKSKPLRAGAYEVEFSDGSRGMEVWRVRVIGGWSWGNPSVVKWRGLAENPDADKDALLDATSRLVQAVRGLKGVDHGPSGPAEIWVAAVSELNLWARATWKHMPLKGPSVGWADERKRLYEQTAELQLAMGRLRKKNASLAERVEKWKARAKAAEARKP